MTEELEVLKIVTQHLNKANIPYMVSGSMATNYYAVPRMTRDIDIVIELRKIDVDKFVNLFQEDFYIDREMIEEEIMRGGMFNLIHNQYVTKIDFIIRKETDFQNATFSRRKKVLIENSAMQFISAEDLILAKLLWAKDSYSEMQLRDVENLIETANNLDLKYIENWISKLDLKKIYKKVKP
ncbi:hypothetical protein KAW08_05925 [bacterium]|nr:hypothetical protein [bacterium]